MTGNLLQWTAVYLELAPNVDLINTSAFVNFVLHSKKFIQHLYH